MVFSSLIFIFRFLPAFILFYFILPVKFRNLWLFLASLVFYAWGEPIYIGLMIFSTVLDYANGLIIENALKKGNTKVARAVLIESVLVNLSLLGVFKYTGLFPLPVGISFYTFQTMSYTIDVYRKEVPAQKDIIAFGAYVSMFPQLIAGPIVKYKDVAEELNHRKENWEDIYAGIQRFCIGLGKKVLIANQIGLLWESVQAVEQMSTVSAWLGSIAYAMQLYFDFSGYSDMAIGLGLMMGFHLKENFDYPYCSKSITEFWRRWHISLGQWFREYVYIPLGGNRKGLPKQIRNIMIVWGLTGIWHGKGWSFLFWGLYFGVFLILEKWFLLKLLQRFPKFIAHMYALVVVLAGMTIFAIENLSLGLQWIGMLFGSTGVFFNGETLWLLSNYGFLFVLTLLGAFGLFKKIATWLPVWVIAFFLSIAYIVDAAYNPFLYFRF